MAAEVVETTWFTNMLGDCIGLVVIQPQYGQRKAYIGRSSGRNLEDDIQTIVEFGAPVDAHVLRRVADMLEGG